MNLVLITRNVVIERVDNYKAFGTWIASDINQTEEIKTRIEVALTSFIKRMTFFTLLYQMEAWTLNQMHIKNRLWCHTTILQY